MNQPWCGTTSDSQDLAFWLPLMALAALLLWTGRPYALLVGGAGLVFWQLEALGVAVDQWYGHHSAPASPLASSGAVFLFAALFLVGAIPTRAVLSRLAPGPKGHVLGSEASARRRPARVGWSHSPGPPVSEEERTP